MTTQLDSLRHWRSEWVQAIAGAEVYRISLINQSGDGNDKRLASIEQEIASRRRELTTIDKKIAVISKYQQMIGTSDKRRPPRQTQPLLQPFSNAPLVAALRDARVFADDPDREQAFDQIIDWLPRFQRKAGTDGTPVPDGVSQAMQTVIQWLDSLNGYGLSKERVAFIKSGLRPFMRLAERGTAAGTKSQVLGVKPESDLRRIEVPNSGFEAAYPNGMPLRWDSTAGVVDGTRAHTGNNSMLVGSASGNGRLRSEALRLPNVDKMAVHVWLYVSDEFAPPRSAQIVFEGKSNQKKYHRYLEINQRALIGQRGQWREYSLTIDDLPKQLDDVRAGIDFERYGSLWVDDVSVKMLPAPVPTSKDKPEQ